MRAKANSKDVSYSRSEHWQKACAKCKKNMSIGIYETLSYSKIWKCKIEQPLRYLKIKVNTICYKMEVKICTRHSAFAVFMRRMLEIVPVNHSKIKTKMKCRNCSSKNHKNYIRMQIRPQNKEKHNSADFYPFICLWSCTFGNHADAL